MLPIDKAEKVALITLDGIPISLRRLGNLLRESLAFPRLWLSIVPWVATSLLAVLLLLILLYRQSRTVGERTAQTNFAFPISVAAFAAVICLAINQ